MGESRVSPFLVQRTVGFVHLLVVLQPEKSVFM